MENLKALVIAYDENYSRFVSSFQVLSWLSNLKRLRLENLTVSSKLCNSIQLKSLRKLVWIRCFNSFKDGDLKLPHTSPNLEEVYTDDVLLICNLISQKKVTITQNHSKKDRHEKLLVIEEAVSIGNEFEAVKRRWFVIDIQKAYGNPCFPVSETETKMYTL
ncbi:hypothetical protein ACLB2K_054632 [Fragaria x ananassa]